MTEERPENSESERVDPDDAPELPDEWFEKADRYHGNKLIRRGRTTSLQYPAEGRVQGRADDVRDGAKTAGRIKKRLVGST